MVSVHRLSAALFAATLLGPLACAGDGADPVAVELARAAQRADAGVLKIRTSLADLDQASRGFGEGVRGVELATRDLAAFETDERATELEKLQAIILQARAWDDAAHAIQDATASESAAARPAMSAALREKSFPARLAAQNAYLRALRAACAVTGADPAVVLELLDGIARHGGPAIAPDQACP